MIVRSAIVSYHSRGEARRGFKRSPNHPMPNFVYIAASLDGFIATPDGGIGWLEEVPNPDGGDFGFADFLARVDAVVMGRKTFEKVLTFGEWPYNLPVFVATTTMRAVPRGLDGKAAIVSGRPAEIVATLDSRGYRSLYIDGGRLIQSFLAEDLVDELIVTRVPILLGHGIPLFGTLDRPVHFQHVGTEVLNDHLVKSRYRRIRGGVARSPFTE